jgi:hypothetical protein
MSFLGFLTMLLLIAVGMAVGFWIGWASHTDKVEQKRHEKWIRKHGGGAIVIPQTTPPSERPAPEPPTPQDRR